MNQSLILYIICHKKGVVATRCHQLHGIQFSIFNEELVVLTSGGTGWLYWHLVRPAGCADIWLDRLVVLTSGETASWLVVLTGSQALTWTTLQGAFQCEMSTFRWIVCQLSPPMCLFWQGAWCLQSRVGVAQEFCKS